MFIYIHRISSVLFFWRIPTKRPPLSLRNNRTSPEPCGPLCAPPRSYWLSVLIFLGNGDAWSAASLQALHPVDGRNVTAFSMETCTRLNDAPKWMKMSHIIHQTKNTAARILLACLPRLGFFLRAQDPVTWLTPLFGAEAFLQATQA